MKEVKFRVRTVRGSVGVKCRVRGSVEVKFGLGTVLGIDLGLG